MCVCEVPARRIVPVLKHHAVPMYAHKKRALVYHWYIAGEHTPTQTHARTHGLECTVSKSESRARFRFRRAEFKKFFVSKKSENCGRKRVKIAEEKE